MKVSNVANTVGVADLSDVDVEDGTYVSSHYLRQALDIADAMGMSGLEVGLLPPLQSESEGDEIPPGLVIRDSRNKEAGIVVASRSRE